MASTREQRYSALKQILSRAMSSYINGYHTKLVEDTGGKAGFWRAKNAQKILNELGAIFNENDFTTLLALYNKLVFQSSSNRLVARLADELIPGKFEQIDSSAYSLYGQQHAAEHTDVFTIQTTALTTLTGRNQGDLNEQLHHHCICSTDTVLHQVSRLKVGGTTEDTEAITITRNINRLDKVKAMRALVTPQSIAGDEFNIEEELRVRIDTQLKENAPRVWNFFPRSNNPQTESLKELTFRVLATYEAEQRGTCSQTSLAAIQEKIDNLEVETGAPQLAANLLWTLTEEITAAYARQNPITRNITPSHFAKALEKIRDAVMQEYTPGSSFKGKVETLLDAKRRDGDANVNVVANFDQFTAALRCSGLKMN
jgi:hypothetical protein